MGQNIKTSKAQIVERKLGREKAFGQYFDGVVEIDPRLDSFDYLDTLIHEMLHHHFPDASEAQVTEIATKMATQIWRKDYRKLAK
jgi:hypothetical protein